MSFASRARLAVILPAVALFLSVLGVVSVSVVLLAAVASVALVMFG